MSVFKGEMGDLNKVVPWTVTLRFGQASKSSGALIKKHIPDSAQLYPITQSEFPGQGLENLHS